MFDEKEQMLHNINFANDTFVLLTFYVSYLYW